MDDLSSTTGIVAVAAAAAAVIALILCAVLAMRVRRLRADQRLVLGDGKQDLVEHAAQLDRHVGELHRFVQTESRRLDERIGTAEDRLDGSVSHSAVLRYDAFNETSGRQSSVVALLDDHGDGVIISAILHREQARVYAKPVQGGRSELDLSPEEQEAMDTAMHGGDSETGRG